MRIELALPLVATAVAATLHHQVVVAFAPQASFVWTAQQQQQQQQQLQRGASQHQQKRSMALDPNMFLLDHHESASHMISAMTSSLTTALDGDLAAVADSLSSAPGDAMDAAAEVVKADNGWFGFLTAPIGGLLQVIHSLFVGVGLDANAWGISIITLTVVIKALTFPLTKTQLESTNKMQAMQPAIKELQAKYQSNPEVMNQKIAEFYQTNDINPLAGCLPSLVQIPVFIGLYRSVLELAKENKLDEPFLFLPNLEGPTYGADPAHGSDWILKNWVDGVPTLGWEDTIAFLILPVFLVISQFVSMELMQPKTQDGQAAQNNIVLKILPVMIGWFALNVPAALSVYWVVNNIVTTASSLYIRNSVKVDPPVVSSSGGGGGGASATASAPPPIFSPPREKPAGFGGGGSSAPRDPSQIKPLTPMDAEIVETTSASDDDSATEVSTSSSDLPSEQDSSKSKKRGKKRKKKN